jgi:hypothetical protein
LNNIIKLRALLRVSITNDKASATASSSSNQWRHGCLKQPTKQPSTIVWRPASNNGLLLSTHILNRECE